ncbi:MAG: hypothetical protein RML56_07890 [Burkholderiales bacterium]|nr:hypothetical protein [Burkholderiales bacterium]
MDLLRYLAGAPIVRWQAAAVGAEAAVAVRDDKAAITLEFADGSLGTIHYLANGHRAFPKERLEVFCGRQDSATGQFPPPHRLGMERISQNEPVAPGQGA